MDLPHLLSLAWPLDLPESALAALVSALATLVLAACFVPRLAGGRGGLAAPGAANGSACDFLINGASLRALTEPARALLDGLAAGGPRLAALAAHYATDCPTLRSDLEALVLYGAGFRHHCPRGDGTAFEIVGEPRGGAAWLSIRPASEEARALADAEAALARVGGELRFLRDVLDRAPVMAWSRAPDGQVVWANAAYRDRFDAPAGELPDHRIANAFGQVIEEVPLTPRGPGSRRRVAVPGREEAEPRWYEVTEAPGPAGETVGFGLDADDLVAAEASLRRFVETLTETFAHLPIGLAVFDKNRRLGLFNPALTDLVKIDAVWLAGRPVLARLPRAAARDPADAGAEGLRLLAAQARRAGGGGARGDLRGELAAALGQDLPRHRPPAPAGGAGLPVRGHLLGDHPGAQVPLRARAQPGDARPHVRGGGGLRRLGHAGLRQLRLRDALGPRPDGAAGRPRRRRDVRALGRALRPARPGRGWPSSPPPARRAPAGPRRSRPSTARGSRSWSRRCRTPPPSSSSGPPRRRAAPPGRSRRWRSRSSACPPRRRCAS